MIIPNIFKQFPGIVCVFSDISDGNMRRKNDNAAALLNRSRLLNRLNIEDKESVVSKQTHGTNVCRVDRSHLESHLDLTSSNTSPFDSADGLFTSESGVYLAIFTADCLPIFFYDSITQTIAAVHAGWRGLSDKIIDKTLTCFEEQGAAPEQLYVWIGPHIKKCHYSFDPSAESHEEKRQAFPHQTGDFLDLTSEAVRQLEERGIGGEHLEIGECTMCHPDRYFSYHMIREGLTGNMMGIIGRRNNIYFRNEPNGFSE